MLGPDPHYFLALSYKDLHLPNCSVTDSGKNQFMVKKLLHGNYINFFTVLSILILYTYLPLP